MKAKHLHLFLTYSVSLVWLINGMYCKVLNHVPRHQEIVGSILGQEHAGLFTVLIGTAEVLMAAWVFSRKYSQLCALAQIIIIACMNALEFFLVPDLLMWGKWNAAFALLLILVIWLNEFVVKPRVHNNT